jgi:hypothetical protein
VLTVVGDSGYWDAPAQLMVFSPEGAIVCQPRHGDIVDPVAARGPLPSMIPYPRIFQSRVPFPGEPDEWFLKSKRGFYFRLCWSAKNSPVSLDGPYLSASIPTVTTRGATPVQIALLPHAGSTSSYSLQATPNPSGETGKMWTWGFDAAGLGSTPPIYLAAVNVSATQQDTLRAFFAGIILGIAGGALIAILQELIAPLSRRRDARHPV